MLDCLKKILNWTISIFFSQVFCNQLKLCKCILEVSDDFAGYDVGVGEVFGFFKAFIFKPEDIEAYFVAVY